MADFYSTIFNPKVLFVCEIYLGVLILYFFAKKLFSNFSHDKRWIVGYPPYFLFDVFLLIPSIVFVICAIHNNSFANFTILFLFFNAWILFYFFVRFRLPGKAWELILVNKHSKNLDTLMVVIGLVFASAFGAITSFEIQVDYFQTPYYLISIFFLYVSTNIVILTILVLLSTYVINTMGNRKPIMMMLVIFIGLGLMTYETISFQQANSTYITKKKSNATKE